MLPAADADADVALVAEPPEFARWRLFSAARSRRQTRFQRFFTSLSLRPEKQREDGGERGGERLHGCTRQRHVCNAAVRQERHGKKSGYDSSTANFGTA